MNLSYEQTEYQIIDRSSFKQFLGLASGDKVPDANTIRNFFEGLKEKGLGETLFQDFVDDLIEKGFIFNEGQIVDASFVLAPRQRNSLEENKKIKGRDATEVRTERRDMRERLSRKAPDRRTEGRNRKKTVIRSRVEHVFGFMEGAMHGLTVRTIGIARATAHIFLKCLTYNMFRYGQIVRNGIR